MPGMTERPFISGLELAELFYRDAVRPLLAARYPNLCHSAALLGPGSEVLGLDTAQSTDHDWGPRLLLFLSEANHVPYREQIDRLLRQGLPSEIHGYRTDMARVNREENAQWAEGAVDHSVQILTVRGFFRAILGYDPRDEPRVVDWLTFSEQALRSVTAGRVFYDGLGELEPVRARLRYYPHDVWLYLLAAGWRRVAQEEAFMGRCGQVGDDLGSRLVAARLVRDLMRLCFLMERQYAPYIKWFGTAFRQLACAGRLLPLFEQILAARSWGDRERLLVLAYERVAEMHNALGVTAPLATVVSPFHSRAFMVIDADRFVEAIRAAIVDEEVRALPAHLGSVDQFVDSTDAMHREHLDRLRMMYL